MSDTTTLRATIRLHDASKRFDAGAGSCMASVDALRHASVEIRSGEVLVVAGPPGSGKTTLLLCTAGLLRCDTGHAVVRPAVYLDFASAAPMRGDWKPGIAILLDSCDDIGALNRPRLLHAIGVALGTGSAVMLAGRNAKNCLSLVPPAATVSVLHLRLGQIVERVRLDGVNRVAEGAGRRY